MLSARRARSTAPAWPVASTEATTRVLVDDGRQYLVAFGIGELVSFACQRQRCQAGRSRVDQPVDFAAKTVVIDRSIVVEGRQTIGMHPAGNAY